VANPVALDRRIGREHPRTQTTRKTCEKSYLARQQSNHFVQCAKWGVPATVRNGLNRSSNERQRLPVARKRQVVKDKRQVLSLLPKSIHKLT
jgi:hypothetical protein